MITREPLRASNVIAAKHKKLGSFLGLTQIHIGHAYLAWAFRINNLADLSWLTENPRVGGSIPPLATTKSIIQIKKLNQNAWALCPICGPLLT